MKAPSFYTKSFVVYCLTAVFVLLVLLLPFRYTFSLLSKYISLQEAVEQANIGEAISSEDELFSFQKADTITRVFEAVSIAAQSHNLIIKQYEPPSIQDEGDVQIQTLHIVLQGQFVDILKCIQLTDAKLNGIKIASVKFNREESNKQVNLVASVVYRKIQVISNNE